MYNDKDLKTLREQLYMAIGFMSTTNDGVAHHGSNWWAGDMPAHPEEYNPQEWEQENFPIWKIWDSYISELNSAMSVYPENTDLQTKLSEAKNLPIADLLAHTEYD